MRSLFLQQRELLQPRLKLTGSLARPRGVVLRARRGPRRGLRAGAGAALLSAVKVVLSAEGLADDAAPAHVAVYPAGGGDAVVETDVLLGAADLGELGPGDYEAVVEEAPVNPDGSTYALPEESTAFAVGGSGEAVELEIGLEPVAVEDMTAE